MRLSPSLIALLAFAWSAACWSAPENPLPFTTGMIPADHIELPAAAASVTVFLFSSRAGWSSADDAVAARLIGSGAAVVGVDLPKYLAAIGQNPDDCVYLVSDIESLSQQIMRAAGATTYRAPILAGSDAAGGLVLGVAAQTPAATIGGTVAVDPVAAFPSPRTLCSGAPREVTGGGTVYGLAEGGAPDPVHVVFTKGASADGRKHVEDLVAQGFAIAVDQSDADADSALAAALMALVAPRDTAKAVATLPLEELPAVAKYNTMAIVYSGDGGWRDIDKSLAAALQAGGVPTIGLDSLRYFWSAKAPADMAADLADIVDTYSARWKADHVVLVGYSFGADVLPVIYNALDVATKARVAQISLLGFSHEGAFEISVEGWLGVATPNSFPTLDGLKRIDPRLIQCFHGADEDDSACPDLAGSGAEIIQASGGHHFDGDYGALAAQLLSGLQRRLARIGP